MNVLLKHAVDCIRGKTIWFVQNPFGSYTSLKMGRATTEVREKVHPSKIESHEVKRRDAWVQFSHQLDLNLCEWDLYSNEDLIAHSESPRELLVAIQTWLRGQHVIELVELPDNAYVLDLDLGARFHLRPYERATADDELFSVKHETDCTSVYANGDVHTKRWDGAQ